MKIYAYLQTGLCDLPPEPLLLSSAPACGKSSRALGTKQDYQNTEHDHPSFVVDLLFSFERTGRTRGRERGTNVFLRRRIQSMPPEHFSRNQYCLWQTPRGGQFDTIRSITDGRGIPYPVERSVSNFVFILNCNVSREIEHFAESHRIC